ncbi:MAG: hypothetical protein AB1486_09075 [Planctomycetota bacterium]
MEWRPRIWIAVLAICVFLPPALVLSGARRSGGPVSSALRLHASGPVEPGVDGRVTLGSGRQALSLLGDGRIDLVLATRFGRAVLEAYRPGHLVDLGRRDRKQPLPPLTEILAPLPASERESLRVSFKSSAPVPIRRVMPLAPDHLYLAGMMDSGDGRGRTLAAIRTADVVPGAGDAGRDGGGPACDLEVRVLERADAALAPPDAGGRGGEGRLDRAPAEVQGFARLHGLGFWGDPVKASFSFGLESGIAGECPAREPDLLFGAHELSLDVRIGGDDESLIRRLPVEPTAGFCDPLAWSRREVAELDATYAVLLRDEQTEALVLLTVVELDVAAARLGFTWRRIRSVEDLEPLSYRPICGRVVDLGGEPVEGLTVWVAPEPEPAPPLPWSLRSATTDGDGGFVLAAPLQSPAIEVWGRSDHLAIDALEVSATTVEIDAHPGRDLSVTLRPAEEWVAVSASLSVLVEGPGGYRSVKSAEDVPAMPWVWRLYGLPAGGYRVAARLEARAALGSHASTPGVPAGAETAMDLAPRDTIPGDERVAPGNVQAVWAGAGAILLAAGAPSELELELVPVGSIRGRLVDRSSGRTVISPGEVVASSVRGWHETAPLLCGNLSVARVPLGALAPLRLLVEGYEPLDVWVTPTASGLPERDFVLSPR